MFYSTGIKNNKNYTRFKSLSFFGQRVKTKQNKSKTENCKILFEKKVTSDLNTVY